MAAVTTKITTKTVVFTQPFTLDGFTGTQAPGTYTVETVEQVLDTKLAPAYLRLSTVIHLHSTPGEIHLADVDPEELEEALRRDAPVRPPVA